MCFIIDTYNPYEDNNGVEFVFAVHEIPLCIRKVELEWGKPLRDYRVDEEPYFHLYESLDEAMAYAKELMRLDGRF